MGGNQLSIASIFVAVTFVAAGLALMRITPPLSMFFLASLFIACMGPGVVYGYSKNKLRGALVWGCVSGVGLLGALFVLYVTLLALFPPMTPK